MLSTDTEASTYWDFSKFFQIVCSVRVHSGFCRAFFSLAKRDFINIRLEYLLFIVDTTENWIHIRFWPHFTLRKDNVNHFDPNWAPNTMKSRLAKLKKSPTNPRVYFD